jgi:hypothetical protein
MRYTNENTDGLIVRYHLNEEGHNFILSKTDKDDVFNIHDLKEGIIKDWQVNLRDINSFIFNGTWLVVKDSQTIIQDYEIY